MTDKQQQQQHRSHHHLLPRHHDDDDEEEEESLTPSRKSLFRSVSWSVRTPNSNSNANNSSRLSKPSRRPLPPLQPLPRPSWIPSNPNHNPSSSDLDLSQICDHIFLGSAAVSADREALRRHGITHVLNCVGSPRCPDHFRGDLTYKTLFLHDSPAEDITSVLYDAFDFLELVRSSSPAARALVHCSKGASRSASLVIAYLMWSSSLSFDQALARVRSARSVTDPNLGFASQLLLCQNRMHALPPSPGSCVRVYRMAPHSPYDPLHLVARAVDRPWAGKLFDSRGAFLVVSVTSGIFVWLGRFCEGAMGESASAAASQLIKYEKVKGRVIAVREGMEGAEFWNVLVGEDCGDLNSDVVGERRVETYDLDFGIFKRALTGGVLPPVSMQGNGVEMRLPARDSGWSRVRKKFLQGVNEEVENEEEVEEEEQREAQFCSPSSLSSVTSGETASTQSTFSPASASSLDWHTTSSSPSGSDLHVAPLPVIVSKLPALHSRKMRTNEEAKSLQCLAQRRGGNPPSLFMLPAVKGGECRLSPRDIVRDWCLSPRFVLDAEEHRLAMDIDQPRTSGHDFKETRVINL